MKGIPERTELSESRMIKEHDSSLVRILLIAAGTISLGLGLLGIFLPLLPTTPFLLLSAACYARSSRRFYFYLITNRFFGRYIRDYREGRGLPVRVRFSAVIFLWVTILISCLLVKNPVVWVILLIVASGVTLHIITVGRGLYGK